MKKRRLSFLFIIMLALSNVFTIDVGAEELKYSEVVTEEYLSEEHKTYENKPKLANTTLDEARQEIKRSLLNLEDEINIEKFNIATDDVADLYNEVILNSPEIFYTLGFYYSYNSNNIAIKIMPKYSNTKATIKEKAKELNSKVDSILTLIIKPSMNEFEKELAIHDYIVLNTRYDEENYLNDSIPQDSYTVYGVLVKGVGVCQGYAGSMKLLLDTVNIDSIIVSSPEMNHAWNIVTLNGKDYHVDATWNDPTPDREGYVQYKYLNLSDEQMKKSHKWDYNKYPQSNSDYYSFLWEITSPKSIERKMYYSSNEKDEEYIYTLDLETLSKKQITNVRAPYFDVAGDWIYFSNYSNGGHLYKIKIDGSGLTSLNNTYSEDIYFKDEYIYYTEGYTGIEKQIKIDLKTEPEELTDPEIKIGWVKDEVGDWYYYDESGVMQTGWEKIKGTWYYMNSSGAMQTGWTKIGNTWYYMNSSGAMQTGWAKVGSRWYYMNSNGAMQTGWTKIGNTWYYMNSSGAMQTGWMKIGNTWYYMNSSGAMQTGWLKLGRNWYYLNSNGSMQLQNARINTRWYQFTSSGRML